LLDSHTLLSHASSVRLDSFVYTVEGLREARARLKDDGVLSLSFSVINPALGAKVFQMMRVAFDGKDPLCIRAPYDGAILFIQSKNGDLQMPPGIFTGNGLTEVSAKFRNSDAAVSLSTDDWPFFYMPRRVYPLSYLPTFAMLFLLSFLLYRSFTPEAPQAVHLPFFFLGAGFMLVETKAITELGLTFGNTWQVIAIALASILLMAFLGNGAVQLLKIKSPYLAYLFLLATLVLGWWVARSGGLSSTFAGRPPPPSFSPRRSFSPASSFPFFSPAAPKFPPPCPSIFSAPWSAASSNTTPCTSASACSTSSPSASTPPPS
jgi:hypothetical protein